MPNWKIPFVTIHPREHDKTWTVGITELKLRKILPDMVYRSRGKLVKEVLESGVTEIYAGWDRQEKDGCYVYVGRPDRDIREISNEGKEVIVTPPPPGRVFVIFVEPDGTIEDWNWRTVTSGRPDDVNGEQIYG